MFGTNVAKKRGAGIFYWTSGYFVFAIFRPLYVVRCPLSVVLYQQP